MFIFNPFSLVQNTIYFPMRTRHIKTAFPSHLKEDGRKFFEVGSFDSPIRPTRNSRCSIQTHKFDTNYKLTSARWVDAEPSHCAARILGMLSWWHFCACKIYLGKSKFSDSTATPEEFWKISVDLNPKVLWKEWLKDLSRHLKSPQERQNSDFANGNHVDTQVHFQGDTSTYNHVVYFLHDHVIGKREDKKERIT